VAIPRVSVLLPVRDARTTIGECLESLAGQTLAEHEVLAVDDGSTDGTRALLEDARRRDGRIRVLEVRGRGLVAALNTGLDAARAGLVARMDADDVCHPERLARQVAHLAAHPETDIVGCRVHLLDEVEGNRGMRAYVRWLNGLLDHDAIVRDLWVESPLAHPSVMARRSVLAALGGYRAVDGPEDYDLWLRAHAQGARFAKVPEVLLAWRDRPRRLSRSDPRYAPERFRAVKIGGLERARHLRAARGVVLWGGGPIAKGWARALAERGHHVAAFVDVSPRRLGQTIHGARVVAASDASGFPDALHLAAVGRPEARAEIRRQAAALGLEDGRDLLAVA
jgi:glycosyltransferase involved in cell wall biosynthesis